MATMSDLDLDFISWDGSERDNSRMLRKKTPKADSQWKKMGKKRQIIAPHRQTHPKQSILELNSESCRSIMQ